MKKVYYLFITIIIAGLNLTSCKKESYSEIAQAQLEFSLILQPTNDLKSVSVSEASTIIITIEDANGKVIKNSEKLELYNMSGSYITKPISLQTGDYKLTRFFVLDSENNVLYASPLQGSENAYLVEEPLPILFEAAENSVTKLTPQVLAVNSGSPESFGYSTFSFNVVETFDFLVGAFIYNDDIENYQLTTASISIQSDSIDVYEGELVAKTNGSDTVAYDSLGVTNKITLPEKYSSYTLSISKPGYVTYNETFTKEELKLHYRSIDKGPLVVILEPEAASEDTSFYIRGNFGGEYLNLTHYYVPGHSCTYYMYYKDSVLNQGSLHIVAHENGTVNGGRWVGLYFGGQTGGVGLNLDEMELPYTFEAPGEYMWTEIQYYPYPNGSSAHYFAITRGTKLKVTIESISNDIIYGKFSGTPELNGSSITVEGEFHGKFQRVKSYR